MAAELGDFAGEEKSRRRKAHSAVDEDSEKNLGARL